MTELLFNQICADDLHKLNDLISKGYFETSDFKICVLNLSNTLAMLHQAIGKKNAYQEGE